MSRDTDSQSDRTLNVLLLADKLAHQGAIHGVGRYYANMIPVLTRKGIRVVPCVLRSRDRAASMLEAEGIQVRYLNRGKFDPRAFFDIVRLVRNEKIDVLHVQDYGSTVFGALASICMGVPLIVHERILPSHTPLVVRFMDRWLARHIDLTLAVSESVKTYSVSKRKRSEASVRVIYTGTPVISNREAVVLRGRALRKTLSLPEDAFVIGTVSRLHKQKGIVYQIHAMPDILKKVPQSYFIIVGDGEERGSLEREARKMGIEQHVRFVGFHEDARAWMACFDIFVQPSLWEGTPQTMFEAMALGKAIVATSVDGLGEVLTHNVNALLVPPADSQGLSQAIIHLIENFADRERLCASALRESASYDIETSAHGLENIYQSIIASDGKHRRLIPVRRIGRRKVVDRADEIVRLCHGKKVLHLGCAAYPYTALQGKHLLHRRLAEVATELWGLDASEEGVRTLRAMGYDRIVLGDVYRFEETGLPNDFDVIVAGELIEHLAGPGTFLSSLHHVMGPNTELILTTPNAFAIKLFLHSLLKREKVHHDHNYYFSYYTISQLLGKFNFSAKEIYYAQEVRGHRLSLVADYLLALPTIFSAIWADTLFVRAATVPVKDLSQCAAH